MQWVFTMTGESCNSIYYTSILFYDYKASRSAFLHKLITDKQLRFRIQLTWDHEIFLGYRICYEVYSIGNQPNLFSKIQMKFFNTKPKKTGYLCFWENGETRESSPKPDPYLTFELVILKIKTLFKVPNSFVGVIDEFNNILQFNIVTPEEIYLDIPSPKEKGTFSKLCRLDEAVAIIEKKADNFSSLKIDGLQFISWNSGAAAIDASKTFLKVNFNRKTVLEISQNALPCEKTPSVFMEENGIIEFKDHQGKTIIHHVGTEKGWYHFCVRVFENFSCLTDCIITQNEKFDANAFSNGANGIRFQPFFISGAKVDSNIFIGQGLFTRGLHFNGNVTNSRIALSGLCDYCNQSFLFHSYHAGFSNAGYFYSESGDYTLTVGDEVPGCPIPLSTPEPKELANLEKKLPKAPDGSRYLYKNPFRCPHCKKPYIDFEKFPNIRAGEYYGNYFDQSKITRFEA